MKTCAPSFANRCAMARPMPLLPPVTTAIFPFNPDMFRPSEFCCESVSGTSRTAARSPDFLSGHHDVLSMSEVLRRREAARDEGANADHRRSTLSNSKHSAVNDCVHQCNARRWAARHGYVLALCIGAEGVEPLC